MWAGLLRLIQSTIAASVVLLPRAGGARHQHQALGAIRQGFQHLGQLQILQAEDGLWD